MCDNHVKVFKNVSYCYSCDKIEFDGRVWRDVQSPNGMLDSLKHILKSFIKKHIDKEYKWRYPPKLRIYPDGSGRIYRGLELDQLSYENIFVFDTPEELIKHLTNQDT